MFSRIVATFATVVIAVGGWVGASFRVQPIASDSVASVPTTTPPTSIVDDSVPEPSRYLGELGGEPVYPTTSSTTSTTTTMPLAGIDGALCPEWWDVAVEAGWGIDLLPKLDRIMWAESRCQDYAYNCCSLGLVQMEWSAHKHWLASEFDITDRNELFDPYTNLVVAKWLFDYAVEHYGCGFQPWYMSGEWCRR